MVRNSANKKNADVTWLARDANGEPKLQYFIRNSWGNVYIMQSSAVSDDSQVESNFYSAVLPGGWTMYTGYLQQDLTTSPAYDSAGCAQYNIFRDSADDAFQQITWSKSGMGVAQEIPGMIIWGGPHAGTNRGNAHADNVIHTAQGNDKIYVVGDVDTIYGDGGTDTAIFRGSRREYRVVRLASDGSEVVVRQRGAAPMRLVATLYDVEWLKFSDGIFSTAFPKRKQKSPRSLVTHSPAAELKKPMTEHFFVRSRETSKSLRPNGLQFRKSGPFPARSNYLPGFS